MDYFIIGALIMLAWILFGISLAILFGFVVRWARKPTFTGPKAISAMMEEIIAEIEDFDRAMPEARSGSIHRAKLIALNDAVSRCKTESEMYEVLLRYDFSMPVLGIDSCTCGFTGLCTGWCMTMENDNVHRVRHHRIRRTASSVH